MQVIITIAINIIKHHQKYKAVMFYPPPLNLMHTLGNMMHTLCTPYGKGVHSLDL
nr:MAG TPA: hypothetical protein [Caudoviricetes sp.]